MLIIRFIFSDKCNFYLHTKVHLHIKCCQFFYKINIFNHVLFLVLEINQIIKLIKCYLNLFKILKYNTELSIIFKESPPLSI